MSLFYRGTAREAVRSPSEPPERQYLLAVEIPSPHVYLFETLFPKLSPSSRLCPEPSGHLMAWVVCSPHFQGSSVLLDYAIKKKRTTTPRAFGVSSRPRAAVLGALEGAFLRQGVPLSPLRPQSSIDWDHPIPAPRETWRHSWGSCPPPPWLSHHLREQTHACAAADLRMSGGLTGRGL